MSENDEDWDNNTTVPRRRLEAAAKLQIAIEMVLMQYGWIGSLNYWRAQGFTPTSRRLVIAYLVPAYCEELAAAGHEMTNPQWADLATDLARDAVVKLDCDQRLK